MGTNLGALTTTFSPPSLCLDANIFYRNSNRGSVVILDEPSCFPPNYVSTGYYSPGFFCPKGYVGTTRNDGGETIIDCCPSQFPYSLGTLPSARCVSTDSETFTVLVTSKSAAETTSTQIYPPPGAIWASLIQLRYKSTDLDIPPTSTPTSASNSAAASASSSNPTITKNQATGGSQESSSAATAISGSGPSSTANSGLSSSSGSNNALSPGAIAGITVAGFIISVIAAWITWGQYSLMVRDRRERRQAERRRQGLIDY